MRNTPFFHTWQARLATLRARAAPAVAPVRACTRCQLEAHQGQWVPADLLPKAPAQENSRDRVYTRDRLCRRPARAAPHGAPKGRPLAAVDGLTGLRYWPSPFFSQIQTRQSLLAARKEKAIGQRRKGAHVRGQDLRARRGFESFRRGRSAEQQSSFREQE